jgi:hypothetical protein
MELWHGWHWNGNSRWTPLKHPQPPCQQKLPGNSGWRGWKNNQSNDFQGVNPSLSSTLQDACCAGGRRASCNDFGSIIQSGLPRKPWATTARRYIGHTRGEPKSCCPRWRSTSASRPTARSSNCGMLNRREPGLRTGPLQTHGDLGQRDWLVDPQVELSDWLKPRK